MIVLTGAAGFIGSCLLTKLNNENFTNIVIADDFSNYEKIKNICGKKYISAIHRNNLFDWIDKEHHKIRFIFHLGARTDTTETNWDIFDRLNLSYSKTLWKQCSRYEIPFIYASSAATYGNGECGYTDDHEIIKSLKPLNPYGISKNDFDKWLLQQELHPPFWAGFKFFNVYGPNEYHKGRMASVIYNAFNKINSIGELNLFRSHKPGIKDGEQKRDFIYIKDIIDVLFYFFIHQKHQGIFNLGTGKARTFYDLAYNTFKSMDKNVKINYIDTPEDIRSNYQYFTEAKTDKLLSTGYKNNFFSLEDGIIDYVCNYLQKERYF
jgi:ADP-L-glycero-D-manno-heptose 6-epimerase